ncbi:MAG: helix-turn-helix domain-containing protein [Gemmobacter sp.]|nr:helix-turn-helix domain-containing protein [Gemmobacter sp.]
MSSYRPVTAVLRGLEVLRVVNRSGLATIKGLHQETGLDKATIVRMLETLIHAGYVRADREAGGYRVTGRAKQLGTGYANYDQTAEICAPILERFRDSYGWPSDFTIRDDDAMIVVRTSRHSGPFNFNRNPGFRAPILLTSIGRAYLAFCPPAERAEILARLAETLPKMPLPARIDRMLDQVRIAGYAVMDEGYSQREYKGAILAIAVPVAGADRILGSLNMMFLRQTLRLDDAVSRYVEPLHDTARQIARALTGGEA